MTWWMVVLKGLIVICLGTLAVLGGSPVVSRVFALADPSPPSPGQGEEAPAVRAAASSLKGGRWIGFLERLAVFAALLTGLAEGIAVVLAIKGLARYPELRAPHSGAAERFIIGTLTSVLFAAGCAGLAWWLITSW